MNMKKVCVAQINIADRDPEENCERIMKVIEDNSDADLVVFPELILQGHGHVVEPDQTLDDIFGAKAERPTTINDALHGFAKERRTDVIFGEIDEINGDLYNLAVFVGQHGIKSYAKAHVHWTEEFVPGGELKTFETKLGTTGILICFDAAFPEASRVLALKGAKVIVVIAAIPFSFDIVYEMRRLQAMAINDQVFVVFANRCGPGFNGCSAVIGPKGEVIHRLGPAEDVLRVEIDMDEVDAWRDEERIFANRRPELYAKITEKD